MPVVVAAKIPIEPVGAMARTLTGLLMPNSSADFFAAWSDTDL